MPPTRERREPGISSWITRAVLAELECRGVDAGPLLGRHGLSRAELLDPDGWIPQRRHARFYRAAIEASGDPAFGVAAGRRAPIHVTRVVGHRAALSETLREAFDAWGRFSDLVAEDTRFGTQCTPRYDAITWSRPPGMVPLHDDGPSFATAALAFVAHARGESVPPVEVHLTGPAPMGAQAVADALGAPILWGADHFEMRFPPGTLDLPVRFADPRLGAVLEETARRELALRDARLATSERVRAAILRLGFDRSASIGSVAEEMGTSARTLQRRLAGESCTFSEIRATTLRDAAISMLAEEGATAEEVAFRLGFESRGGFHHAMKRWTGRRPGEWRARREK